MPARGSPANIKLLILDADGVLTDGSIWIDDRGHETKRFNVRDGFAMRAWLRAGKEMAVITGRGGLALRHRLDGLGVRHLISASGPKKEAMETLLKQLGIDAAHAAVMGDDLPDLPMLKLAGYPMAVADAADEVKALAAWSSTRNGGHGAVREAVEFLLKASGEWDASVGGWE
ncbi:MAG: HAD hydrolase family protein [Planctomycetes bacterium]|nr:HAD hydrolase family protein [Planctomycetota bacterium]